MQQDRIFAFYRKVKMKIAVTILKMLLYLNLDIMSIVLVNGMSGTVFSILVGPIPCISVQFPNHINIHVDYLYIVSVNRIIYVFP